MRFCENCGSYMEKTTVGFSCPQCGRIVRDKIIEIMDVDNSESDFVYVMDGSKKDATRSSRPIRTF